MEPLDWESKSKIIDRLRLEVITELTSGSGGIKRSEGRIRGLNYAAMWIRFVNESK